MTESPQLLANVEFDIVKKGYDPEQVDNYLRLIDGQVGQLKDTARQAVEQAEVAHARAAEAQREKATYLADAEQAKADLEQARLVAAARPVASPDDDGEEGTEALKKMLLLAQRTADNHVEEAQASAKNIVADARTKAAEIVAGAETRAERLLIEAQKVADELVRERSEKIAETVSELERRRDLLRADSEVLERYLTEHRQRLQHGVTTLAALLNDDSGLKADPMPSLKAEPDPVPPIRSAPAPTLPKVDDVAPRPTSGANGPGGSPVPSGSSRSAASAPEPPRAKADPTAPTASAAGKPTVVRVSGSTATASRRDPEAEFPAVKIPELLETPREIRDRADEVHDTGPPTMQLSATDQHALLSETAADGDELMPPLDPVTDEAMTRFFEEDFDEDGKPRRFRRK